MNWQPQFSLDSIHHIAIEVDNVEKAIDWYVSRFNCRIAYQDETWALVEFENANLALVTKGQHPPHIGFVTNEAPKHGELSTHRDGTRSTYVTDPAGNAVELLDPTSVSQTT